MASILDRNSQRELDVEAFAGGSHSYGAYGAPLYRVQSTQTDTSRESPPPRYFRKSPQRPQRVYSNHPFRHSTNSHDEENIVAQQIPGSLRTRASDSNVTRRPQVAEPWPSVADSIKSNAGVTTLFNLIIVFACFVTIVTSWDSQGNFDTHIRRAKWAIQVVLMQLGFLIYEYWIIGSLPKVEGEGEAEAFREWCTMSRGRSRSFGTLFWLVWGTVVFVAY